MARRVVNLSLDSLDQLSEHCRRCVFWELSPGAARQAEAVGQAAFEKEAWISSVLLQWGSCGRTVAVDSVAAGSALYAPPSSVPRSESFPTAPVSADAVLLTSLQVDAGFAREGLGRMLIQAVAHDLTRRGVHAIEAFGDSEVGVAGEAPRRSCVLPTGFLLSVGFEIVQAHPRWPRLRMDLRAAISWKEGVEAALERLLVGVSLAPTGPRLVYALS